MTKGRKTTFEERVQQARNYMVKYETGGVEALRDNRGKRKRPDEIEKIHTDSLDKGYRRREIQRMKKETSS